MHELFSCRPLAVLVAVNKFLSYVPAFCIQLMGDLVYGVAPYVSESINDRFVVRFQVKDSLVRPVCYKLKHARSDQPSAIEKHSPRGPETCVLTALCDV